MSDRIDPRRQTREIREALARFEPDQVLEILTHVFRQYVVEGSAAPPLQMQDELVGLKFAQVIERLQLRLDLPELRLFEIQAGRVMVRIDGRLVPVEVGDTRTEPLPMQRQVHLQPQQPTPPTPAPNTPGTETRENPAPTGTHAVGHASAARPQPSSARPAVAAAPPPARAATSTSPQAAAAPAPAPRPEKAQTEKSEQPGGRFGLLEID